MLDVTEWEQIRRMHFVEGKGVREIARETGRARRTVTRMLESEEPPKYRRKQKAKARVMADYKERIRGMLRENKTLPRKQRWTSPRIYEQIKAEGFEGAESTVRHFVAQVRKELKKPEVYLPLEFDPATDAQVDWGEADVIYEGEQRTVQLFYMKLCYSRRTFMMAFPNQRQEAFFAAHVAAFDFFGGVPHRISYDNLKTAVQKVLKGRNRIEQDAFIQFRGTYLFASHFCQVAAGNEKGIVENSVGFGRRRFLVPLPRVESFAELNAYLLEKCRADDARQVSGQPATIGQMWLEERTLLRPTPTHPYDCCRVRPVKVNRYSQVQLETNRYSVPCDSGATSLTAKLYPLTVKLYKAGQAEPVAVHGRCYGRYQEVVDPLHYLPLLVKRPYAFQHTKPLRRWRKEWPPVYEQLLTHLQQKWPEGRGIREFVAILHLHQHYPAAAIAEAIEWALVHSCAHLDGVRLWLHQLPLVEPVFKPLDLRDQPRLLRVGQQPVRAADYDGFLGGVV